MAAALRPESRHPRGDEVRLHPPTRGPGTSRPVPGLCSSPARPGSVPAPRIRSAPLAPPPPGARSQLGLRLWPLRSAAAAVSEHARRHVRARVLRHFPDSDGLRPRSPCPSGCAPRLPRAPAGVRKDLGVPVCSGRVALGDCPVFVGPLRILSFPMPPACSSPEDICGLFNIGGLRKGLLFTLYHYWASTPVRLCEVRSFKHSLKIHPPAAQRQQGEVPLCPAQKSFMFGAGAWLGKKARIRGQNGEL